MAHAGSAPEARFGSDPRTRNGRARHHLSPAIRAPPLVDLLQRGPEGVAEAEAIRDGRGVIGERVAVLPRRRRPVRRYLTPAPAVGRGPLGEAPAPGATSTAPVQHLDTGPGTCTALLTLGCSLVERPKGGQWVR